MEKVEVTLFSKKSNEEAEIKKYYQKSKWNWTGLDEGEEEYEMKGEGLREGMERSTVEDWREGRKGEDGQCGQNVRNEK